jgi:hypothetical protein
MMTFPEKALAFALHDALEVDGAGLFLAFDDQLEVQRQLAPDREDGLDRFEIHPHLALVVHGSASVEVAVSHLRLERRCALLVKWVDRLHIVVAVDERGRQG